MKEVAIISISIVVAIACVYVCALLTRVAYQLAKGTRPPVRVVHTLDSKQFAALIKSR